MINKGALQGKVFFTLKQKFTRPCSPAPKAHIVGLKRWHKKVAMAKVQKNHIATYKPNKHFAAV